MQSKICGKVPDSEALLMQDQINRVGVEQIISKQVTGLVNGYW